MYRKPIIVAACCAIVILISLNLGCQSMLKQGHIEASEATDVPVSPYGFGPYPELPPGYPIDFWDGMSKEHELIARVRIKLNAEGGAMIDGLVYPIFRDTVYVKWSQDGEKWYVSNIMGDPETVRDLRGTIPPVIHPPSTLTAEDFPEDIKVYTMPDGGIDPYEFLNLKK